MKLKHLIFAAVIWVPLSSDAAIDTRYEWQGSEIHCQLSHAQQMSLDAAWDKLARRFFFASMEVMEDPDQFLRVRAEVKRGHDDLKQVYGMFCVRPIGGLR